MESESMSDKNNNEKEKLSEKSYKKIWNIFNGPRLCERPGYPLKDVWFDTISVGDFKLQQKSASVKIFTLRKK